jgi:diketogulonate reductase-like aldo/keto reductase
MNTNITLNNGVEMPWIGMGTWPLNGWRFALLVRKAVKYGYHSFDLASAYGNETWFGRGLKICGQKRADLFITTKLSNTDQRTKDVRTAFCNSLARLGLQYLDLYLMHWPVPDLFVSSWKQMEVLYKEGLVRAIGVCNFHQHHLEELLKTADVTPAVNQIELHPLLSQKPLVKFCKELGIQVEAYSPVARMHERLVKNETMVSLAAKYQKTVPQIILRWDFQNGIPSVPKSSNPERLKQNIHSLDFALSEEEVELVDNLNEDIRVRYDPDNCDFDKL